MTFGCAIPAPASAKFGAKFGEGRQASRSSVGGACGDSASGLREFGGAARLWDG